MRRNSLLAFLAGLSGCTTQRPDLAPHPAGQEIVATEHAFAADLAQMGGTLAFRKYVAADAITYVIDSGKPRLLNAKERLDKQEVRPPAPPGQALRWWPDVAAMSNSGDLGFTSGPYFARNNTFGYIFTVWRRQADGTWKWIWDGGPNTDERPPADSTAPVTYLRSASRGSASPEAAKRAVTAIETALDRDVARSGLTPMLAFIAPDARVMGSGGHPAGTPAEHSLELGRWGTNVAFHRDGIESSSGGDLVFTYGRMEITRDTALVGGQFRVWQKREAGWRLVFVEALLPPRKPPAQPVAREDDP